MAYKYNNLIVRKRSGLSGFWDDFKDVAKGAVDFYGEAQRNAGAAAAAQQQTIVPPAPSGGIDTNTLLVVGALGIGAILLLKRKKS